MKCLNNMMLIALVMLAWNARADQPQTLTQYRAIYDRETQNINSNRTFLDSAAYVYAKTLESLDASFRRAGDLAGTKAVLAEVNRYAACGVVPETPPDDLLPELATAQSVYRAAVTAGMSELSARKARLDQQYVAALKKHIATLLQQNRLDEAEVANSELTRVQKDLAQLKEAELVSPPLAASTPPQAQAGRSRGQAVNSKQAGHGVRP